MESGARASLLLFDVGNSGVKIGLAAEHEVLASYVLHTDPRQSPDDLGLRLLVLLGHAGSAPERISACVACSVVPAYNPVLREACLRYFGARLLFVPDDIPVPLRNLYERPAEVGADRLVGAYAARKLFPEPKSLICVDYGTALTFDCVTDHSYLGGLIFPGVRAAANALAGAAAKLPDVSLEVEESGPIPGRGTSTSINHGIMFGYASLVEGLCARLSRLLAPPVRILSTGGFAAKMQKLTPGLAVHVPGLLLDGLRLACLENAETRGTVGLRYIPS
jgi:type III pantothenate kinase